MNRKLQRIIISFAPVLTSRFVRGNNIVKIFGLILVIALGAAWLYTNYIPVSDAPHAEVANLTDLYSLYETQQSGVMVNTVGDVTRILADDNEGSRHQRFIITAHDGLSVLIAHNIDLAPRIPLRIGDRVAVFGQYEWNHKGGLIHWTHHDPKKQHPEGWIMHKNKKYE